MGTNELRQWKSLPAARARQSDTDANAARLPLGRSQSVRELNRNIRLVARFDSKVLILGETGTGKEIVARAIHEVSERRRSAFVPVNCGAIPAELLESELFGHERGAFSGAINQRKGRFELADGGTIFLDEIGEMPLAMQVKLLRVLQEGCYERVGSNTSQRCNVRVIAATHRDLEELIRTGRFREDLYHRLNVCPIEMPPLRNRAEDLPGLIDHFVAENTKRGHGTVRLSERTLAALARYSWPGNVRELENLIERLAVMCHDQLVEPEDLPPAFGQSTMPAPMNNHHLPEPEPVEAASSATACHEDEFAPPAGFDLREYMQRIERRYIEQAMERSGHVIAAAAQLLGLKRTTLLDKVRRYQLDAREA